MPAQDTTKLKDRIISFIRLRGPSLPVHIAKSIETSMLFTSAFLSELFAEKVLKMSHLRVGSSPVYFIRGQEKSLEKFSNHLRSKEKEAFNLLKENNILKDSELDAPIKVAIREIKDFAIPFHKDNELYWRYLTFSEEDIKKMLEEKIPLPKEIRQKEEVEKEQLNVLKKEEDTKPIKKEIEQKKPVKKILKKKPAKKKSPTKKNDKFFNKVKEFLAKSSIEILDIESFNKNDLVLRINISGGEKLLVAYNKRKLDEKDIINASKKASKLKLKYIILSFGEPAKKTKDFIEAGKSLDGIEKID